MSNRNDKNKKQKENVTTHRNQCYQQVCNKAWVYSFINVPNNPQLFAKYLPRNAQVERHCRRHCDSHACTFCVRTAVFVVLPIWTNCQSAAHARRQTLNIVTKTKINNCIKISVLKKKKRHTLTHLDQIAACCNCLSDIQVADIYHCKASNDAVCIAIIFQVLFT